MRKNFALFLVALVALTLVFAAYGCGSKPAETTSTEATENAAPADTGMGGMHDSTSMMADTTKK